MNPNRSMGLSIDRFDIIDFNYGIYKDCLKQTVPENFNFAFDIIDAWGKWSDKIAIEYILPNGNISHSVSYCELSRQSTRYANTLLSLGLNKGDYVCIMSDIKSEWYSLLFGCMKAGIIFVPCNIQNITDRINHSSAKAILTSSCLKDTTEGIYSDCPTLQNILTMDDIECIYANLKSVNNDDIYQINREEKSNHKSTETMMADFISTSYGLPEMVLRDFTYTLSNMANNTFKNDINGADLLWALTKKGWEQTSWKILFAKFIVGSKIVLSDAGNASSNDMPLNLKQKHY